MNYPSRILFLGETYRADAQTWIQGIEQVSGIKIDTLEVQSGGGRITRILRFLGFGLKILKGNFTKSYDLVLAERATSYGFFSLFVRTKKRVIAQQGITDAWPENGFSGVYKRFLQKIVYQKADLIHAWGQVMVPAMLRSGANQEKILVLPKGLDLAKYTFGSMDQKDPFHAIVTRSLSPVYHHSDILEAVHLINKLGKKLRLTLIGDGELRSLLEEQAIRLGIADQVNFLGRIPNATLPNWLQQAAIYLSVPETEGVSASLFEAMACGCFPIVTDLEGTRAWIAQGKNGLLIPVKSPQAIADSILEFWNKKERFEAGILANRRMIEEQVDLRKNMQVIWNRYLQLYRA